MGNKKINFTHSIELGLDTGGSNWFVLYRGTNVADANFSRVKDGSHLNLGCEFNSIIDYFVHIGSAAHLTKSKKMSNESLADMINKLNLQKTFLQNSK